MYGGVQRDVTLHGIYTKMPVASNCEHYISPDGSVGTVTGLQAGIFFE
jgi:hypothetical protein